MRFTSVFGAIVLVIALIFFAPLVGALFGAFAGWIVGLFFDKTILTTLARFGVNTDGLAMWQLGCMLGFVTGFFKTPVTKSKD